MPDWFSGDVPSKSVGQNPAQEVCSSGGPGTEQLSHICGFLQLDVYSRHRHTSLYCIWLKHRWLSSLPTTGDIWVRLLKKVETSNLRSPTIKYSLFLGDD